MKDDNIFLWVKAVIAAACGAFTAAFGWLGWLVMAWAACMVLDWLSGSAAAASRGEWASSVARDGIWHKAGMIVVVCVAALTDAVLSIAVENLPGLGITYQNLILPVVLVWYIFTELGSIAENAAHMGADVPDGLLKLLAAGKNLLAYGRFEKDEQLVIIVNNSSILKEVTVPVWLTGMEMSGRMKRLIYTYEQGYTTAYDEYIVEDGEIMLNMGAYSAIVLKPIDTLTLR